MRRLGGQLCLTDHIWLVLLALGRREILRRRAFGAAPSALADEEPRANGATVYFVRLFVHNELLCLHNGAWLALVIHAEYF